MLPQAGGREIVVKLPNGSEFALKGGSEKEFAKATHALLALLAQAANMKKHSLLFGIQHYPKTGSLTPLKCPHADVDALAEVLGDPRYMGEVGQVVVKKDVTYPEARWAFRRFSRTCRTGRHRHHPLLRARPSGR